MARSDKSSFHPFPRSLAGISFLVLCLQFVLFPGASAEPRRPRFGARPVSIAARPLPTSVFPTTVVYTSSAANVQLATASSSPATLGQIVTAISKNGDVSKPPFQAANATQTTARIATSATASLPVPVASIEAAVYRVTSLVNSNTDIFKQAVATDAPPAQIVARDDHPATLVGAAARNGPLHTNKFYESFLLAAQDETTWTHPYSVWWAKAGSKRGGIDSWGLAFSNSDRSRLAVGPPIDANGPAQYLINPIYIQSIIMSATELGASTALTTDSHKQFSVNVNLGTSASAQPAIRFPIIQGMGFLSGLYTSSTPLLQSGVSFTEIDQNGSVNGGKTYKWNIKLADGTTWLLYVTPNGAAGRPAFQLTSSKSIQGPSGFTGLIQIAKSTGSCAETALDSAGGTYATSASLSGTVSGNAGTYSIKYTRAGSATQKLLMFALPHHVDSMTSDTRSASTCLQLYTTTKGLATGFLLIDTFTFVETDLPTTSSVVQVQSVSNQAKQQINDAASYELAQNVLDYSNVDSAYYGAKALSKYALTVLAVARLGQNSTVAAVGLQNLQTAFARWISNKQLQPFVYDTKWGGVVSQASYGTTNDLLDFGNTYYNDHHFHYGYFVHTAAIIGYLDPKWLTTGTNKAWVNALVRDYANSIENDPYFPPSRMFDWYHGHSWATGLYAIADGKSQESSSEDTFSAYAMKLWGSVIGDAAMEARGNLQLAIQRRSLNNYYLYSSSNTVEPSVFIANKAAGIMFENKIDHQTYFGGLPEYIEGIHIIPISPITAYIRGNQFVSEEWDRYFKSSIPPYAVTACADAGNANCNIIKPIRSFTQTVDCNTRLDAGRTINCVDPLGWRAVLYANYAQVNPTAAWNFFAAVGDAAGPNGWDWNFVKDQTRTWYLAYVAAMGGL